MHTQQQTYSMRDRALSMHCACCHAALPRFAFRASLRLEHRPARALDHGRREAAFQQADVLRWPIQKK